MKPGKNFIPFLLCFMMMIFLIVNGCSNSNDTTTYTISGTVTVYGTGTELDNVTINMTGSATSSATTGSNGDFSFSGLSNGTYTLTPALTNYTFNPVSTVVVINGSDITDTNFVATSTGGADTYSISGTVTGAVQSGVKLTLSSGATGTVMTGSDGTYSFANVEGGTTYIVTPSLSGYTFSPEYSEFAITSKDAANIDFTSSN
ncbi:MAG TPA: carboxypeptidase-like regulatory domain-containing protein [Smithella sp.]|nr:carboxypeptidase-like regulatory domain-containing protein [Smithella sp.]